MQAFINMLCKVLRDSGCKSTHEVDDADVVIVNTAIQSTSDTCTVVTEKDILLYNA